MELIGTVFFLGLGVGFISHMIISMLKEDNPEKTKYYFLRKYIRRLYPRVKLPQLNVKTSEQVEKIEEKVLNGK